jgi:tetraacyldisaccharide 4'-kinase
MKIWAILLLPFAWMYGAIMSLRNVAYDRGWKRSHAVGVPVISIGNITVGGTGKTPMAEFLLAKLLEMGLRPAYLSRGYGRQTRGFRMVEPAAGGGAAAFGDEALQVATRFPGVPVAVCEDRVAGAQQLLAGHPVDVLVLDDAFQHRRIRRDLDIVMVDASRMPLQDWPFPAGRLREPRRGLGRAHTLVLTKFRNSQEAQSATAALHQHFPRQTIAAMILQPQAIRPFFRSDTLPLTPSALQGKPVIAFSGLGNNTFFRATLEDLGATVVAFFPFPDHYVYQAADMEKILQAFETQTEIKGKLAPALILTTEKDYFRLMEMSWMETHTQLPLHYLEVGMAPLEGWEGVEQQLSKITRNI